MQVVCTVICLGIKIVLSERKAVQLQLVELSALIFLRPDS